jgi:hypothetical protein
VQWLKRLLTRRPREAENTALWVYVRCRRCGEAIQIRADRRYDLANEWRHPGESGPAYTMHKDIVGDRCFQRICIDMGFDSRFRIVEQQIEGGEFLTAEAYAAVIATSPSQSSPDAQ